MGVLVIYILYSEVFLTLTEVFPCFFLSCKANARVKLAKTENGPHCSTLVVIYVVLLLFVLFHVLFVCKCVLPPGDNPTAVNKYIISYFPSPFLIIISPFIIFSFCLPAISTSWLAPHLYSLYLSFRTNCRHASPFLWPTRPPFTWMPIAWNGRCLKRSVRLSLLLPYRMCGLIHKIIQSTHLYLFGNYTRLHVSVTRTIIRPSTLLWHWSKQGFGPVS